MRSSISGLTFFVVVQFCLIIIVSGCTISSNDTEECYPPRIAHAGGGYMNWQLTNSHEALEFNRDHFSLFEIDLLWTRDGSLVCLHDWEINAQWIFGRSFDTLPTLEEFEQLVDDNPYVKNCTLETLTSWLIENPEKKLVTDIKEKNVDGLSLLSNKLDQAGKHVIPQIYHPEEYGQVRELGYQYIIWTLYRYQGTLANILDEASKMDLFAVTMPRHLADQGLAWKLGEQGIHTYVHTINTQRELENYQDLGVDEIYTDWLAHY